MESALDNLAGTAWDTASDDELLAAARDIETWSRRLYSVALSVTAELDTRGVAAARGATSTAVLLRQLLRITPAQARRRLADARAVRPAVALTGEILTPALPVAAAALASGTISDQHLQVIRQTVEQLPPAVEDTVRAAVETTLVADAAHFDPVQLVKLAHRVRAHLDPDGTLHDEQHAITRRELSFTPDLYNTVLIRGRLDTEAAAIVQAALAPLAAPLPADPHGIKDQRTPARRRADALVQAAQLLLNAGVLPTQGGQRPHLAVTITLADLRTSTATAPNPEPSSTRTTDTATSSAGLGGTGTDCRESGSTRTASTGTGGAETGGAETGGAGTGSSGITGMRTSGVGVGGAGVGCLDGGGGAAVTVAAARRIACDASVIPIVLGARSEPLDIGRASYTVPQPMRRALIARDHGCAFPGCDRPPNWCEAHHIIHVGRRWAHHPR